MEEQTQDNDFLAMVQANNEARAEGQEPEAAAPPEPSLDPVPDVEPEPAPEPEAKPDEDLTLEVAPKIEAKPKKEKKSKEENMKSMRTALKAERERISALEAEIEETKSALSQVGDIEEYRAAIEERDKRISELEHVESLVGMQSSKEYQERYVEGVDTLAQQALTIAKDYEVSDEVVKAALSTGNRRQLNDLLGQHFDPIAVGDIRPVILEIQGLLREKAEADKAPQQSREELLKAAKIKEKAEQERIRNDIKHVVSSSWDEMQAVYSNKDSGVSTLQEISGNEEHNTVREDIIKRSSEQYGKVMGILVKNGIKTIPDDLAKAFAARFQLAEVAGHLIGENQSLRDQVDKLEKKVRSSTSYSRPLSSGANTKSGSKAPPKEVPTEGIAAHVLGIAQEKLANQE